MGTDYSLYKIRDVEFSIDEMSNLLQLCAYDSDNCIHTDSIKPTQMLELLLEGIKVTSYWMSKKEFDETFSKLENYSY